MPLRSLLKRHLYATKVPARLAAGFTEIGDSQLHDLERALRDTFYARAAPDFFATAAGKEDLSSHLLGHLAEARFEILGLRASFVLANATEMADLFQGEAFDFIIFYASLEHMTHQERLASLESAWNMLRAGSFLVVTETPNRLWFYDFHTSFLPFFMWLPDDLAFRYSRFSGRDRFREVYQDPDPESMLHFLRRGRGVSFHEFDLAIGPVEKLTVVSSLAAFHRRRLLPYVKWRLSRRCRFSRFLSSCAPALHHGFFEPRLDLIVRKS